MWYLLIPTILGGVAEYGLSRLAGDVKTTVVKTSNTLGYIAIGAVAIILFTRSK